MNEKNILLKKSQGERLRILREYLGLTQTEFGKTCGLKWSQVKDRESGVVEIKLFLAMKIEDLHGINHNWLLTGQGEMKASPAAPSGGSGEFAFGRLAKEIDLQEYALREEGRRIDDLADRVKEQGETITSLTARVDSLYAALLKAEEQKDFLPLKVLRGTG